MSAFWQKLQHKPVTSWQGCGWFRPEAFKEKSKRFLYEFNSRRSETHRGNDYIDPAVLAACQAIIYESPQAGQRVVDSECPALQALGKIVHRGFFRPVSESLSTNIIERMKDGTNVLGKIFSDDRTSPAKLLEAWAATRRTSMSGAPMKKFDDEPDGAQKERPFWTGTQDTFHGGALAPWVHPQPLFRHLFGEAAQANEERRADFLICPPWTQPLIVEIHGEMDARDKAKDQALREAGWQTFNILVGTTSVNDVKERLASLLPPKELKLDPAAARVLDALWVAAQVEQALHWALYRGLWSPQTPVAEIRVPNDLGWVADAAAQTFIELAHAVSTVWSKELLTPAMKIRVGDSQTDQRVAIAIDPDRPTYLAVSEDEFGADLIIRRLSLPWVQPQPPCVSIPANRQSSPRPVQVLSRETWVSAIQTLVRHVFCHSELRPGQLEAIERALTGPSCLVIMPAGSGKSLVFQLAALLLPGATFVIEAWRALIDDQIQHLYEIGLGRCVGVHRNRPLREPLHDALIVYMAPERLFVNNFEDDLKHLLQGPGLSLFVLDEAHAASEAGHSFRPSYLGLVERIQKQLKSEGLPETQVLALTATAADLVVRDVCHLLKIKDDPLFLVGMSTVESGPPRQFIHSQMKLDVFKCSAQQGFTPIKQALEDCVNANLPKGKGIIFCASTGKWATSRRPYWYGAQGTFEHILKLFPAKREPPVALVVGGKGRAAAASQQQTERFREGQAVIMVATSAFGTGIDVREVRWVCHLGFPAGLEAYYQEICRAGRDGKEAQCLLIYDVDSPRLLEAMNQCQGAADPIGALRVLASSIPEDELGSVARRLQLLIGRSTRPPTRRDLDLTRSDSQVGQVPPFPGWQLESEMIDQHIIRKLASGNWCKDTRIDFPEHLGSLVWRSVIRMRLLGIIDPGYRRTFNQTGRDFFELQPTGEKALEASELAQKFEDWVKVQRGRQAARSERQGLELGFKRAKTPQQRAILASQTLLRTTYKTVCDMRFGSLAELYRLIGQPQEQRRQLINDYFTRDPFSRQIQELAEADNTVEAWNEGLRLAEDRPPWRTGTFLRLQSALPGAALPAFLLSLSPGGTKQDAFSAEYSLRRWLVDVELPEKLAIWALQKWMASPEGEPRQAALDHLDHVLASTQGQQHTRLSQLICLTLANEDHQHPVASAAVVGWLKPILEQSR